MGEVAEDWGSRRRWHCPIQLCGVSSGLERHLAKVGAAMTARGLLPLSVCAAYALAVLAASKWLFGANALLPMTVFLAAGAIILAIYLFLYWYIKGTRAQAAPASGVRAADAARTAADLVREADTTLEKSPVLAA